MYDRLYIEYLYYFNVEQDYYECHEVMEEYWLGQGKNRLLLALLQVAVGLHHFNNGNVSGAVKLLETALEKSNETWQGTLGIDKEKLFIEADEYVMKLRRYQENPFSFYPLHIEITDPVLDHLVELCDPEGVAEEDKF
jgi:predicted metal-dependent hydrolase